MTRFSFAFKAAYLRCCINLARPVLEYRHRYGALNVITERSKEKPATKQKRQLATKYRDHIRDETKDNFYRKCTPTAENDHSDVIIAV